MKIVTTGDIHYDLIQNKPEQEAFLQFVKSLEDEKPDVLVLTGDIVGLGAPELEECLNFFSAVAPERLMVYGNHEYWSSDGDTFGHLESLKIRIKDCGFGLLDEKPAIIGGIGFAGNCSWYDYSFAATELPPRSSYEKKIFKGHIIWNDVRFVRLGIKDEVYTNHLLEKLDADMRKLEPEVDHIVAITHHIGFPEMLTFTEDFPGVNFCNAFMGSSKLGDLLLSHTKVKYHICGHTHFRKVVKKGSLVSINHGSTYAEKKYMSLEIP